MLEFNLTVNNINVCAHRKDKDNFELSIIWSEDPHYYLVPVAKFCDFLCELTALDGSEDKLLEAVNKVASSPTTKYLGM